MRGERDRAVRQVRTVTGERDFLRRDVDRLSAQLSDMEVTAGSLQRDLDSARASVSSTSTLAILEDSASHAAQQVEEISRLLGELSDLDRIVDESYDQIADLGDERDRLREDFQTLTG